MDTVTMQASTLLNRPRALAGRPVCRRPMQPRGVVALSANRSMRLRVASLDQQTAASELPPQDGADVDLATSSSSSMGIDQAELAQLELEELDQVQHNGLEGGSSRGSGGACPQPADVIAVSVWQQAPQQAAPRAARSLTRAEAHTRTRHKANTTCTRLTCPTTGPGADDSVDGPVRGGAGGGPG